MRRIYSLLFMCCLAVGTWAQTQQGIVKTRGRMVNGKHVAGQGLSGATVTVQGRSAVLSQTNGGFSFPVPGKSFMLQGVQKNGYQLVDLDACRNYQYSANPLYLIMEKPEQQQADLLAAERKIRKNLRKQLDEKEAEIEALQVSQQEKDSLLRILYQQQTDNEKLIADMARRYSMLDYDQLDEFYRQVSSFIENGELTRADSLLRTRGDINAQVEALMQQGQTIQEQEAQLQQAKTVHQTDIEEAARRCYGYYETFFAQHQNDSAAHYLELRTRLDTTNVSWSLDTGRFLRDYLARYADAETFYQRAYDLAIREKATRNITSSIIGLSSCYRERGNYEKAESMLLQIIETNLKQTPVDSVSLIEVYGNIAHSYFASGQYEKALHYQQLLVDMCTAMYGERHDITAIAYNNTGNMYIGIHKYQEALGFLEKALSIRQEVLDSMDIDLASTYNGIGGVYLKTEKYSLAEYYFNKALVIRQKILGNSHPDVATVYNNLAGIYEQRGEFDRAIEIYNKCLEIREHVYGKEHAQVAMILSNIGSNYAKQKDYILATEYMERALKLFKKVLGDNHPYVWSVTENLAIHNIRKKDYLKALDLFDTWIKIMPKQIDISSERNGTILGIIQSVFQKAIKDNPEDENLKSRYNTFLKNYGAYIIE